jgi:polyisoprenoid-binding protein YceI
MIGRIALSMLIAAGALSARATELEITVDPDRSKVTFELKATLHTVHGSAGVLDGNIRVNTETGQLSGDVAVDALSADTGNRSRDKKMHSKVLLSELHPRIVLRLQGYEGDLRIDGESTVKLMGVMELSGSENDIELPVTVKISGNRVTIDATFEIPYVEWGLKNPSTFALRVAKEVPVSVLLEGAVSVVE